MAKNYIVTAPFRVDRETGKRLGRYSFTAGAAVSLNSKDAERWAPWLREWPADATVEQATAAPGETRNVKKPKKK